MSKQYKPKGIVGEAQSMASNYYESAGRVQIIDGLYYSQWETIKDIEYYWNSAYRQGNIDENGQEKPFYNISKYRTLVAVRATDLDTKDIKLEADTPEYAVKSMLLNHELYDWFKEVNFAKTLNLMGHTRAKYGGVLVKKVEDDNKLTIEVPMWRNVITDQIDINNGATIEKHWLTPYELSLKREVWTGLNDNWDNVLSMITKEQKNNLAYAIGTEDKLEVWEVEGMYPACYLDEYEENEDTMYTYLLQKHFIAVSGSKTCVLYSKEIKEKSYKYLAWDNVSGRGLGVGIVEDGIQAQINTNDAIMKQKRMLEYASRVFFISNDDTVPDNVLTDAVDGDVFKIAEGRQMNIMNTTSNAFGLIQGLINQWNTQYERASSTFNAITGENLPSGTPFALGDLLNQEAGSIFDYRREEMGIFLTEILFDWILPHLEKKLRKAHNLSSEFSAQELQVIDTAYAQYRAFEQYKKALLSGKPMTAQEYEMIIELEKQSAGTDAKRYLDVPENFYKDTMKHISVVITGENKNKRATLANLSNILTTAAQNPAVLQDPALRTIFDRIIEVSGLGLSPANLPKVSPMQQAPQTGKGTEVKETLEEIPQE